MNKVFKVIWSEARNAYVVVSEMAKNHGSKSCSTKKLLAMLIATGVMTCASFDVLAVEPAATETVAAGDTDVHIKDGNYTVDKDNKVSMNLVDKAGKSQGTVTITGVAKTEDVAVVYDKNKTSLRSTNATLQTSSGKEEAVDSIALGNGASAVKGSVAIGNGASVVEGSNGLGGVALGYKAHAGYKGTSLGSNAISGREGTTLVGANTNSKSLYTTVVGTDSVINSDGTTYKVSFMGIKKELNVQGATATVVGSKNTVDNKNGKVYSGVANNVMGSANTVEGSNGVTIQGTGNKVTDAYKDMNIGALEAYNIGKGDYSALAKKKSGAVAVIGGANTVSKQTDSTVIGYDNKLTGDNEKGSHDVFMAGSHNTLTNVSDSIVMGNKNTIEGVSNVISFGHQNTISASANNAVAIGNGAGVSVEGGVALGVGSVADRAAEVVGYDPATGVEYVIPEDDAASYVWKANAGAVSVGSNGTLTRQITNVAAGSADTDAVNVAQLKRAMEKANFKFEAGNGIVIETVKGNDGTTYKISTNIIGSKTDTDTTKVTSSASGDAGTIDGNTENIVPNPGSNTLSNQPAADNNSQTGAPVVIETVTQSTNFAADDGNTLAISPSEKLGIKGDNNITTKTDANGKNIQVTLNKYLNVDSVNANKFTAGDTTITNNGLEIKNGPSVTNQGINAGDKKVNDVADGEISATSKDAVNGSQLHETNTNVANNSMRINKLGNRVNKVGAGAAALAALHPMDFDPDDKLTFSAGYGNYGGENAAAIGAYYRPDEKVMFSVAGTVGNGENMVNAGVSFALDRTNHVSNSRTALAREVIDLRGQLAVMGAKMAKMEKAFGMLDETKTKLFPDVPANHWAYEYIAKLAGNGYIEGYPDGNFGGDRLMTRYEFAAMLYRAIENGAALEEKIIKEFEPELGRIRVDRISGEDGDRDKIERVRVNDTKGERDHYGNKLAK